MPPRKLKARRQGCWIEATGSGLLRLRFRWRLPTATGLHKFSETTTLHDTPENRGALSKQAAIIGAEIAGDRFDYLRWSRTAPGPPTFRQHHGLPIMWSRIARQRSASITNHGSLEESRQSSGRRGLATTATISERTSYLISATCR